MRMYYESIGKKVFDYVPLTFHVKEGLQDKEWKNFLEYYSEEQKQNHRNIWIVKPGEHTNRGCGINVCNTLE